MNVLLYVRNSPIKLIFISISKLIEKSLEKIKITKVIEIKSSKNNLQIKRDPIKLEDVIINLIANTIQEMLDEGKLGIKIYKKENFRIH
ncbi:MAG: hypothetical protein OEM28_06145 [Nitrosopumilus sp.]|nr:hypothetical protein [Nitrosopumilus sp.]MDH3487519.1 hypothetical protein [Nitrosopumilus sp.]